MVFVIIPLFLFQNFLFLYVSPIKQDENYYIKYSDVSFNLDIEEEQQYHFDDLSHNLELSFSFPSLEEKGVISIELKIQTTISSNNNSNFEIKKEYYFDPNTAEIYNLQDYSYIGKLPIFLRDEFDGNQKEIIIDRFNNNTTVGYPFSLNADDDEINTPLGKVPANSILVDNETYTVYHYSKLNNVLVNWCSFNEEDLFFLYLLNASEFHGYLQIVDSNIDIGAINRIQFSSIILIVFGIIMIFSITFFIIKKNLDKTKKKHEI
ncbi:MAG: hypothetical protein K9W44_01190 [Candidatus Lokiarchaeota archaeon]|nr:hypothetical protein [Candidatus Harpocratesius repetitus]